MGCSMKLTEGSKIGIPVYFELRTITITITTTMTITIYIDSENCLHGRYNRVTWRL